MLTDWHSLQEKTLKDRVESIVQLLRMIQVEASTPYNDGWVSADCKKDLVMIRYELNKLIEACPEFSGEEKWEQEIVMKILKEE